jgi:hypothetical protein
MENKEREIIKFDYETISTLWNKIYFKGNVYEIDGDSFVQVDKINESEYCDGDCFKYIIQRKSDGKYFKFDVWNTESETIFSDGENSLTEVFRRIIEKVIYE